MNSEQRRKERRRWDRVLEAWTRMQEEDYRQFKAEKAAKRAKLAAMSDKGEGDGDLG